MGTARLGHGGTRAGEASSEAMRWARLVDQFADHAGRCSTEIELRELIEKATRELGFDHFALLHHASLRRRGGEFIRLDNYPAGWSAELVAIGMASDDPVHLACGRTNV